MTTRRIATSAKRITLHSLRRAGTPGTVSGPSCSARVRHTTVRRLAVLALAMLSCATGATPAAAGVIMQLRELPGSLQLTGDFFTESSTPISASTSAGDGFEAGSVSYDSLGLHASIHKDVLFNSETRFGVWAILRYEDLQITSDDGAGFVSGLVNLDFDGSSILETSSMTRNRVSYLINPGVSTASGGNAASVSRIIWVFGDDSDSNGFLSGWDGNGSISVSVPVTFSTTASEFLQIEIRITVDALVRAGESGTVDVNFADTMSFADPSQLITFTSGLNPTINSTTGEIVNNAIAVPEPAAFALLFISAFALVVAPRSIGGKLSIRRPCS